jgi:hypothetical protein
VQRPQKDDFEVMRKEANEKAWEKYDHETQLLYVIVSMTKLDGL